MEPAAVPSRVELICPDLVSRSKIKYLLPSTRKATLARNVAEFARQLSVMLAIYWRDGPRPYFRG